ncbi:MAG: hypothetical protein PHD19_11560 [Dechloromonas sp.]|nr:hypothetical protein [Dechloromonas sp.]
MTTITALPTPPSRLDPVNFRDRADAFLAALLPFTAEANALAAEVNADKATIVAKVDLAMLSGLGNAAANAATAVAKAAEAVAAASAAQQAQTLATAAWTAALAANPDLNPPVRLNPHTITANLSIPAGYNAQAAGPLTIAEGVVVEIADGASFAIN